MKSPFINIFLFLFSINCYCQSIPEDYVITLTKDTVFGNIEIKHDIGGYVRVILRKDNVKKKYDRYNILGFKKDGRIYETINIEGVPEFYCRLIEGELTLYSITQLTSGGTGLGTGPVSGSGNTTGTGVLLGQNSETTKYCFQRKGKKIIMPYNHKELAGIFLDYNELYLKILNKEITDKEYMVKTFNDWYSSKDIKK